MEHRLRAASPKRHALPLILADEAVACAALLMLFEEGKFPSRRPVFALHSCLWQDEVYAGMNLGGCA